MSGYNILLVFLMLGLILFVSGCAETGSTNNKESTNKPVGGVAVGISPKIIYAESGGNISFTVDMQSTENADDRITININGTWINKTFMQDIQAGAGASVPIHITVPPNAGNMSFTVKAISRNLNATSSTTGMIIIGR